MKIFNYNKHLSKTLISMVMISIMFSSLFYSCQNQNGTANEINNKEENLESHQSWSKNANIYEVNIRQCTKEGTFNAFADHLPRLKELGVDILWLMPVFPIGEVNRKGKLGSYYSIKDYRDVNPEFGTMEDFVSLVNRAHELGFKVILDWVANHSAWDNPWIYEHPDWYTKDSAGQMIAPYDWTDVADLNYDNPELRKAMIDALLFWVRETNIDGFRCDVAYMVPTSFWEEVRLNLDSVKPVFMLAEAEMPEHHRNAFDMSYAWELHHIYNSIANGEKNANAIKEFFAKEDSTFPEGSYRMNFITNHDENSWNGTIKERLGAASEAFAVLSYTLPGMPLIYSGQEAGLDKRLRFFDKDTINWNLDSEWQKFYITLNTLKKENKALWNGSFGGDLQWVNTSNDTAVLAFSREKDQNKLFVITNLTDQYCTVTLTGIKQAETYYNTFKGEKNILTEDLELVLNPWEYMLFIKK